MTTAIAITGNVVTPSKVLHGGCVVVVGSRIVAVYEQALLSKERLTSDLPHLDIASLSFAEAAYVLPGFVDIHNHGLGGHEDVIGYWSNAEYSLKELARCGTLCTLASLIFPEEHMELVYRCIEAVESRVGKYLLDCCILGGIHAEGPVIQDRGGLPPSRSLLSQAQFKALCARMPSMRVMTISPHIDSRDQYAKIRYLLSLGVRPALGHDRVATKTEILGALRTASEVGVQLHTTHFCNVMKFHHRNVSLVNIIACGKYPDAPAYKGVTPPTTEVIADLVHLDAVVVQSLLCCRPTRDVALITDCISEHRPNKRVRYDGRISSVRADGGCYLCAENGAVTKTLAGGTSCLADQFFSLVTVFKTGVVEACLHTATVPARIAQLTDFGSIEVGKRANILLMNSALNTVERRMIDGQWTSHSAYRVLETSSAHI